MSRHSAQPASSPRKQRLHHAMRVVGIVLAGVALAALLLYTGYCAVRPFFKERQIAAQARQVELQVKHKQAEKQKLEEHIAWLRSPQGAEELARKKGLVKPGEVAVRMTIDAPKTKAAPAPTHSVAGDTLIVAVSLFAAAFLIGLLLVLRRRRLARRRVGMLTPRSELRRRRPAHEPAHES